MVTRKQEHGEEGETREGEQGKTWRWVSIRGRENKDEDKGKGKSE